MWGLQPWQATCKSLSTKRRRNSFREGKRKLGGLLQTQSSRCGGFSLAELGQCLTGWAACWSRRGSLSSSCWVLLWRRAWELPFLASWLHFNEVSVYFHIFPFWPRSFSESIANWEPDFSSFISLLPLNVRKDLCCVSCPGSEGKCTDWKPTEVTFE